MTTDAMFQDMVSYSRSTTYSINRDQAQTLWYRKSDVETVDDVYIASLND